MRTLVYCTAYAATVSGWQTRYRRWLDAVLTGGLNVDQVLIVDDGSATLPGWPELSLYSGDELGEGVYRGAARGRCCCIISASIWGGRSC